MYEERWKMCIDIKSFPFVLSRAHPTTQTLDDDNASINHWDERHKKSFKNLTNRCSTTTISSSFLNEKIILSKWLRNNFFSSSLSLVENIFLLECCTRGKVYETFFFPPPSSSLLRVRHAISTINHETVFYLHKFNWTCVCVWGRERFSLEWNIAAETIYVHHRHCNSNWLPTTDGLHARSMWINLFIDSNCLRDSRDQRLPKDYVVGISDVNERKFVILLIIN